MVAPLSDLMVYLRQQQQRRDAVESYHAQKKEKPKKHDQIYKGDKRTSLIDQIVDALSDWRLSQFENEGAIVHGLRSALCLKGNGFQRSHDEAVSLVSDAFKLMGVKRPDWIEGQWHYSIPSDYCAWCHSPVEEDVRSSGYRYCTPECARYALEHRAYENHKHNDLAGAAAYRMILKHKLPELKCEYCNEPFRSHIKGTKFCSPACIRRSRGDLLDERQCLWCRETFAPRDHSMYCCSKSCAQKQTVREYREMAPEKACAHCLSLFRPAKSYSIYCSPSCSSIVTNRQYRLRNRVRRATSMNIEVFDYYFSAAIVKQHKPITPQRFDWMVLS